MNIERNSKTEYFHTTELCHDKHTQGKGRGDALNEEVEKQMSVWCPVRNSLIIKSSQTLGRFTKIYKL